MLTTSLGHKLFCLNQTNLYDTKNVMGFSKPYSDLSHRQFDVVKIVYDFSVMQAGHTIKIACSSNIISKNHTVYYVSQPLRKLIVNNKLLSLHLWMICFSLY